MREITIQEILTQHIFEPSDIYYEPDHCRCGKWFERPGQKAWAQHVAELLGKPTKIAKFAANLKSDPGPCQTGCPHRPLTPIADDRWKCTICGQTWNSIGDWLKDRADHPSENSRTFEQKYRAWLPRNRK